MLSPAVHTSCYQFLGRSLDGLAFHSLEIFKVCVTTSTNAKISWAESSPTWEVEAWYRMKSWAVIRPPPGPLGLSLGVSRRQAGMERT
jgi:hypothetical protein